MIWRVLRPARQQNPLAFTAIEEATTPGTGDIDKATNRFRTGTTYDEAGQVTTDSKFRQMGFAYDANGRQVKATSAYAPDAWTVYDAGGNRVATKINSIWQYMVYDAMGKLVAEYGQNADGLGGVKYVQQDWQGSVRTVTNNNGFVVSRTDHQAFGGDVSYGVGQRTLEKGYNQDATTRQGYGLTERDEATGQDHTWFRKNENQAGRWTSPDPYNGSMNLGDPQSFNRYSYVGNDPTNFVDPNGLMMCSAEYSYEQCGGSGGFWTQGYNGFGDNVAIWNELFGDLPLSIQEGVRDFLRQLGNAPYLGDYSWAWGADGVITFSAFRGWDGLFDSLTGRFNLPPQSGLNDDARLLIQDLGGRRGPALLNIMLALEAFAALIVATPVAADAALAGGTGSTTTQLTQFSNSTLTDAIIRVTGNTDKMAKIFGHGKHLLDPVVARFGSQAAVVANVINALNGRLPADGIFRVTVTIGGYNVVVQGNVVNGVPLIGNFWVLTGPLR